jgi:hypothetical protein
MNLYPGDIIKVNEPEFNGYICGIDRVSSDYVRLCVDGVFGHKRWVKKSRVELNSRPAMNWIRDITSKCYSSIDRSVRRATFKLKTTQNDLGSTP